MKSTFRKSCRKCNLCSEETGKFPQFDKIADLRNLGLVIYRHVSGAGAKCNGDMRQQCFIFHNTTNIDIAFIDILAAFEQQYKQMCSRCRSMIAYTETLLKNVPKITRKAIRGICDRCKTKKANSCYVCAEVLKYFNVLNQITTAKSGNKDHVLKSASVENKSKTKKVTNSQDKEMLHITTDQTTGLLENKISVHTKNVAQTQMGTQTAFNETSQYLMKQRHIEEIENSQWQYDKAPLSQIKPNPISIASNVKNNNVSDTSHKSLTTFRLPSSSISNTISVVNNKRRKGILKSTTNASANKKTLQISRQLEKRKITDKTEFSQSSSLVRQKNVFDSLASSESYNFDDKVVFYTMPNDNIFPYIVKYPVVGKWKAPAPTMVALDLLHKKNTNVEPREYKVYTLPTIQHSYSKSKRTEPTSNKSEDANAEFTFYFPIEGFGKQVKDQQHRMSSADLKERMRQFKLLVHEKLKEEDDKKIREEVRRREQEKQRKEEEARKKRFLEEKSIPTVKSDKKIEVKKKVDQTVSDKQIKTVGSQVVEKKKKITMRYDKSKLNENESVIRHSKLKLPLSTISQNLGKELKDITNLVSDSAVGLSNDDKSVVDKFVDKVDDVRKLKKRKDKKNQILDLPVPKLSGTTIKRELKFVTNLFDIGLENLSKEDRKKVDKLLRKLDKVTQIQKLKKVNLPFPQDDTAPHKRKLHHVTELFSKTANRLSEKDKHEMSRFVDKLDGALKYDNRKTDDDDFKLTPRQQLKALEAAYKFSQNLKTITKLLMKPTQLDSEEREKIKKFISKLDDIEGMKRRIKKEEMLEKSYETSLKLKEKTSITMTEDKIKPETAKEPQDENIILKLMDMRKAEIQKLEAETFELGINEEIIPQLPKNYNTDAIKSDKDMSHVSEPAGNDIVLGTQIVPKKYALLGEKVDKQRKPLLFKSRLSVVPLSKTELARTTPTTESTSEPDESEAKGILRYALSDRQFIDKGLTVLPTSKTMRRLHVYNMRPAKPEFDWFKRNRQRGKIFYDTGEKLAEFDQSGKCIWYYRNGRVALEYYEPQKEQTKKRYIIYSTGEADERKKTCPYTVLATFDYLGNGVVFDHTGKLRIKYNQCEGVVLDRTIGPISHWKWHTLNDPPVFQHVLIEKQMAYKDPKILKYTEETKPVTHNAKLDVEEMLAIEFDNYSKQKILKTNRTTSYEPFKITMKALKINDYFSLKILDQSNIYLLFRDGKTKFKLNLGMILDHKNIIDSDVVEVKEVILDPVEQYPACSESIDHMQRKIDQARRTENLDMEHRRRICPEAPNPAASVERLKRSVSKPLKPLIPQVCQCEPQR